MKIPICFATDDKFFKCLCVCVASILKNANVDDEFEFYILNSNCISHENKNIFTELKKIKNFEVYYIDVDKDVIENLLKKAGITIAPETYFRLFLSSLLPKHLTKVIYLDGDTIVCESIKDLFMTDLSDYYIAGVEDIGYYDNSICFGRKRENFTYVNAGLILVNLEKFRKENVELKFISFLNNPGIKLFHHDQDIINFVLHDKCKILDLRYNVQDTFYNISKGVRLHPAQDRIKKALKNPAIIHFSGSSKPWKFSYSVYAKYWFKYLKYTPYKHNFKISDRIKFSFRKYFFYLKLYFRVILSPILIFYRNINFQLVIILLKKYKFKIF